MQSVQSVLKRNNLFPIIILFPFLFLVCKTIPDFKQKPGIDLSKIFFTSALGQDIQISKTAKNEFFIAVDLDYMKSGLDIPIEMSKGVIRKAFIIVRNSDGVEIGRQLLAIENLVTETRVLQENDKKENSKVQTVLSSQRASSQSLLINPIPNLGSHLVVNLEFNYLEPCDPVYCENNKNMIQREWFFISRSSYFKVSKIDGLLEKKVIEDESKIKEAPILKKEEKKERNYPQQRVIKPIG
ncbi:hypothetical protein [Leptospira sp. GIMC2001]|uniref:hypothetical protein n=1 Tax=Leptospira sp. GIMC2001 TaxID=1513297 RepID=UPI002349E803|nr:hypothetical protein [Leptospira sp. GIMC2001]WCL48824.1 hypothetical protein O4O04_16175 [Leptospira sp. GIMC2001]